MLRYDLSYWERETFFKEIDLAIIGSGLVGMTAALHLHEIQPDLKIAILERGVLPLGASTRNAGFACFGSITELMDDMNKMPEEDVLALVEKRYQGLQQLRALVGDQALQYKELGGYEMFTENEEAVFQTCLERLPDFNRKIGSITGHSEVYCLADEHLPRFGFKGVKHLLLNQAEGQVHTGLMMKALWQKVLDAGIAVYNGFSVSALEDMSDAVELHTPFGWSIRVPGVLVAVNGFAQRLLPDLEVTPARNQVLITKPIPGLKVEGCFHYDRGYYYFRNIDNRILLGGGRQLAFETERTDQFESNELIRQALIELLQNVINPYEPVEIDSWWTGILGLGPVKKPIIKKVSSRITVAVRLSGMGVAIGALVGREGAELVLQAY